MAEYCTSEDCYHAELGAVLRRAPNGAIGMGNKRKRPDREDVVEFVSADARGMFFRGEMLYPDEGRHYLLYASQIQRRTWELYCGVQRFYAEKIHTYPGMISLAIGFKNIATQEMVGPYDTGGRSPDSDFREEQLMTYEEFMATNFSPESFGTAPMMRDVWHAFGFKT